MSRAWSGPLAAAFAVAFFASSLPAAAECVGKYGEPRSGVRDRHSIRGHSMDSKPFVRLTRGPATVQVDVKGATGSCSHKNEKLSFEIYSKRSKKDYVECLSPSVQGPAGFLSCWFRSQKNKTTIYNVEVYNDGPCRLNYDLICWNGRQKP